MLKYKLALLAATALVGGVLAVPAFAEVTAVATITKEKDITIFQTVTIDKTITVTARLGTFDPDGTGALLADPAIASGLAEASVEINALIDGFEDLGNTGVTIHLPVLPEEDASTGDINYTARLASVVTSMKGNGGVTQLNQDVGENANQGNVVSAALTVVPQDGSALNGAEVGVANSQAHVDQRTVSNNVEIFASFPGIGDVASSTEIDDNNFHIRAEVFDFMTGNFGITQANQNAGQNNNQHNAAALAVGVDAAVALAEGDLGQVSALNDRTLDVATFKRDEIDASVLGNSGLTAFNQAVGHNNNQATVISIAATSASSALLPDAGP